MTRRKQVAALRQLLAFPGAWLLLAAACALRLAGAAEAVAPIGMVEQPCAAPLALPASARELLVELFLKPRSLGTADIQRLVHDPGFAAYNDELRRRGATDWAGLCRYQAANAALSTGAVDVVFIGDSITENWLLADPAYFTAPLVNRGISAQTSAQMLLRFQADVVALRPSVVHVLAGTNDVAGNNGPVRPEDFRNNLRAMVTLARANGIRVVLGSIPPTARFDWQPSLRPAPQIIELNAWMRDYARQPGVVYVDYHGALKGPVGELDPSLGNDGVHPNEAGYRIMRRLADAAIDAARRGL